MSDTGIPSMVGASKALLLCQHFYPEMISTGMHMTELSIALTRLGWQINVCCAQPSLLLDTDNPHVPSEIEYCGIRIVRMPSIGSHSGSLMRRVLFAFTYFLMSAWFVYRTRKHFNGLVITTNPPFLGMIGWLAAIFLSKPYVLVVYDVYPDIAIRLGYLEQASLLAWAWDRMSSLILNRAAAVVVIGRDMRDLVMFNLDKDNYRKVELIPNWSDERIVYPVPRDENAFRKEYCSGAKFVVQYSGRMARTHNLEPLIEAAELLRDSPILFQFIGDGAKRQTLIDMAKQRHLSNIQFLPYQPLEKLNQVLSAADLAVICLEGLFTGLSVPSKAYGVMASATPILGFLDLRSEIGQTVMENDCGIVLPDPNGAQVAETITYLMNDPDRLHAMGVNGYNAFKRKYSLTCAASKYSELMQRVFVRCP